MSHSPAVGAAELPAAATPPGSVPQQRAGRAHTCGSVTGAPQLILRVEGLVLLIAALVTFGQALDEPLWLVPALLLLPDLLMVGYARSNRLGAVLYNLGHSYPAPAALAALATVTDAPLSQAIALIWFAHIGMDRALGYGLKYPTDFTRTHLGRTGPDRA